MDAKNLLEPVLAMVVLHAAVWIWMPLSMIGIQPL